MTTAGHQWLSEHWLITSEYKQINHELRAMGESQTHSLCLWKASDLQHQLVLRKKGMIY